jgi:hypothetical protein
MVQLKPGFDDERDGQGGLTSVLNVAQHSHAKAFKKGHMSDLCNENKGQTFRGVIHKKSVRSLGDKKATTAMTRIEWTQHVATLRIFVKLRLVWTG